MVEKSYDKESRKIVNVLQVSKIDLVEWFLRQLENLDLPKQVLENGRKILSDSALINAAVLYGMLWNNLIDNSDSSSSSSKSEEIFRFKPLPSKIAPLPNINLLKAKGETEKEIELKKMLLRDLNPYSFTAVLTEYKMEKASFGESADKYRKKEMLFLPLMSKEHHKDWEVVSDWWFNEVVEYLPSSRLVQCLTVMYFNDLTRKL
jgi:hypothetical protein